MTFQFKNFTQALSLALLLASPMSLCAIVSAEPVPSAEIRAQESVAQLKDRDWENFKNSGYSYFDAKVLAAFWNSDVLEAKYRIGTKANSDYENKLRLSSDLVEARAEAIHHVKSLKLYSESGYNYSDAEALANFWGEKSPYQAKLRIEEHLILGSYYLLEEALKAAKNR